MLLPLFFSFLADSLKGGISRCEMPPYSSVNSGFDVREVFLLLIALAARQVLLQIIPEMDHCNRRSTCHDNAADDGQNQLQGAIILHWIYLLILFFVLIVYRFFGISQELFFEFFMESLRNRRGFDGQNVRF